MSFQELYAYAHSTTDETTDEDEVGRMQGDLIDLEPELRDAVVLALPNHPLCREDCPGLCPECGAHWDDLPADHSHRQVDPRWAALEPAQLTQDLYRPTRRATVAVPKRKMSRSNTRSRRAQWKATAGRDRGLPAVPLAEAAARRVHRLRHVQRSPGRRGLIPPGPR